MKRLKRYIPFFRAGMLDLMAFKFQIFSWFIITAFQVACMVFLWVAIYHNSPDSIINGYSFHEMIVYMVMINIFTFSTMDNSTSWKINDEIRTGTIAMAFVKPISYRMRFVASNLGSASMLNLLFGVPGFTIAFIIFGLMGYITFPSIGIFLLYILLFLIAQLLATMLNDVLSYIFGILSFYTLADFGLDQIKSVITAFFSGTLIPLAFFPGVMSTIVSYMPFAGMAQNPVLILMMKIPLTDALLRVGLALGWLLILEGLAALLFARASKKVTVQGG